MIREVPPSGEARVPPLVQALQRSRFQAQFTFSCDDATGEFLAVLSASIASGGRILEIGTGMGVGLAWITSGLGPRDDITVVTIDRDAERLAWAQELDWPEFVEFIAGDVMVELPNLGSFDLIFADAEGGKWYGLDLTIDALNVGGILLLDDFQSQHWNSPAQGAAHLEKRDEIRRHISGDSRLASTELSHASGLLLAVRRSK